MCADAHRNDSRPFDIQGDIVQGAHYISNLRCAVAGTCPDCVECGVGAAADGPSTGQACGRGAMAIAVLCVVGAVKIPSIGNDSVASCVCI